MPYIPEVDPTNGYEYVDLGLPSGLKWAKCNIGAEKESDYGLYFQWGDVVGYNKDQVGSGEGKKHFSWSDYKYCNGTYTSLTKYCTNSYYGTVDNKTVLEPSDDAATVNMGGCWRIPSKEEYNELLNNTTNQTHYVDGVPGRLFISKINNNTLFFPLSGRASEGGIYKTKEQGNYWSCSLKNPLDNGSCCLTFDYSGYCSTTYSDRYYGYSVRGIFG